MDNIVTLVQNQKPSMESAAETLRVLENHVLDGLIIAFAIVGIGPDDNTKFYTDSVRPVSNLRMIGALHHALWNLEWAMEKTK